MAKKYHTKTSAKKIMKKKTYKPLKVIGEKLIKKEARLLSKWWNANSKDYFEVRKRDNDKYYDVVRV